MTSLSPSSTVASVHRQALAGGLHLLMVLLVVLCWPATNSDAVAETSAPATLVQRVGNDVLAMLTQEDLTDAQREQRVRRLVHDSVAVDVVARFVLGRYWKRSSPRQREAYQVAFRQYLVTAVTARLAKYSGEQLNVTGERAASGKSTIVDSTIDSPAHGRVQVQWRIREVNGVPKIVDIIVEGVSMLLTQRSEFAAAMQSYGGDINGLIDDLKAKAASLKANSVTR